MTIVKIKIPKKNLFSKMKKKNLLKLGKNSKKTLFGQIQLKLTHFPIHPKIFISLKVNNPPQIRLIFFMNFFQR